MTVSIGDVVMLSTGHEDPYQDEVPGIVIGPGSAPGWALVFRLPFHIFFHASNDEWYMDDNWGDYWEIEIASAEPLDRTLS